MDPKPSEPSPKVEMIETAIDEEEEEEEEQQEAGGNAQKEGPSSLVYFPISRSFTVTCLIIINCFPCFIKRREPSQQSMLHNYILSQVLKTNNFNQILPMWIWGIRNILQQYCVTNVNVLKVCSHNTCKHLKAFPISGKTIKISNAHLCWKLIQGVVPVAMPTSAER